MIKESTYQNNNTATNDSLGGTRQETREQRLERILSELPLYESPKLPAAQKNAKTRTQYKPTSPPAAYRKRKSAGKKAAVVILIILLFSAAGVGGWFYWWVNHATFEYSLRPVVILEGQSLSAHDFLTPHGNMPDVESRLQTQRFASGPGIQGIPLTLNYGWRSVNTIGTLYVLASVATFEHEFAAESRELLPMDFISNADVAARAVFDLQFTEEPLPLNEYPVGAHTLHLSLNDTPFLVTLYVKDTTPPTATAVNMIVPMGQPVYPEDFVTDVFDASPIANITFSEEPDVLLDGEQVVEVIVEDYFGNSDSVLALLSVLRNETPPTLNIPFAAIDSMVGTPIIYRTGVTAFDSFGRALEVNVDSREVDQHTEGSYTVIFWVEDCCRNRTQAEITVNIIAIDPDYVNQRVDDILATILSDDMTDVQAVREIHRWVRRNVSHAGVRGGPESAYEGAYIALRDRRGNCFIFQSIAEVMLTRAGIPNMRVERIPVPGVATTHRWSLINPDGLGWHHFDANPVNSALNFNAQMYMFTDTQAIAWTARLAAHGSSREFFTFDRDLFPEVVQ